jgi:hypothetical protein
MSELPYTEEQLRNLIEAFEETLAILTCPTAIEYKKRDIADLRVLLAEKDTGE